MESTNNPQGSEQQPAMAMATGESSLISNRDHVSHHDLSRTTLDLRSKSLKLDKSFKKREKRRRYRRNRNMRRHASKAKPDHAASRAADIMSMDDPKLIQREIPAHTITQVPTAESSVTSGIVASMLATPVHQKTVPVQEPTAELQSSTKKQKSKAKTEMDESNPFTSLLEFVSKVSCDMEDCGDALLQELSDLCSTCRQFVNIGMMSSEITSLLTPMVQSVLDAIYSIGASYPEKYLKSSLNTIKQTNENLFIIYDWCPGLMQFTSPVDTERFTEELCSALAMVFDESYFRRTLLTQEQDNVTEISASEKSTTGGESAQNHDPGEGCSRGPISAASSSTHEEIPAYDIDTDLDSSGINGWYTIISANLSSSDIDIDFELRDDFESDDNFH
ncbi:hypothetical protein NQZ79_g2321 [Umbelopsis isabellina]|nr:hypothetical protein NQZ79_g2321 [Umbelopsis isabellina]